MQHTTEEYTEALSAAVKTRDLPRAALCAKELLKRRAHVKLRSGIIIGLGMAADVDERYAQSVCEILLELRSCDISLAASALATCMKSVSTKTLSSMHKGSTVLINSEAVERAMAKSGGDEDMANLMAKTLGAIETAAALAKACVRNGRDPTALKSLAKCTFLKNKEYKDGSIKLLLACVRASRTKRSDIYKVCVNASLEKALTPEKLVKQKKESDDDVDDYFNEYSNTTGCASNPADDELKMAVIWTFVPKRTEAMMTVEQACSAVTSPEDMKIITGFKLPEPSMRVSMIERY